MSKKYVSLNKLSTFLDNLKTIFAPLAHGHKVEDISDFVIDSDLSSISNNPVANFVIDAEFEAVSSAMGALEAEIDAKAPIDHDHDQTYLIGTDAELILDGVAADAKATGAAINEIQVSIEEIAIAMGDLDNKVDIEEGKGLSTEDYTTSEKDKLATIESNANFYEHPAHTSHSLGLYQITVDDFGHISSASLVTKKDIVALGVPEQDTTYDTEILGLTDRINDANNEIKTTNEALSEVSKNLEDYIESNNDALSTNVIAIDANKNAIEEIQSDYLKSEDKTQLQDSIKEVSDKASENAAAIEILNGDGDGSVKQSINSAFNDFAANVTNDDVVNTYKELIDYAATHGSEFTTLVGDVSTIGIHVGEIEDELSDYKTTVSDQFNEFGIAVNDHVTDTNNPHYVTKEQIGLENVDNTSDMDKPISNAMQAALDEKADVEHTHEKDIFIQNEEPADAPDGSLWVDTDADGEDFIDFDPTLTLPGYAADAKAVGDALAEKQPKGNYATENFVLTKIAEAELSGEEVDLSGYATKDEIPTKTSQLRNDSGFITSYTETDPTVPAWAKAPKKPTYTASEVGALPANTVIPDSLADLATDSAHRTVSDSEKSAWNAKADISDIPTVPTKVSAFENDKGYLTEHQSLEDYALKSDIPTDYIKSIPAEYVTEEELNAKGYLTEHQSLAGLATETYVNTKIGEIDIPDSLSDLATDSTHRVVTDAEKEVWNAKSNFSGDYNDLSNKPTIPSISGLATEQFVKDKLDETKLLIVTEEAASFQEIIEAVNAGRVVQAVDSNGFTCHLVFAEESIGAVFTITDGNAVYGIIVTPDNQWQEIANTLPNADTYYTKNDIDDANYATKDYVEDAISEMNEIQTMNTNSTTPSQVLTAMMNSKRINVVYEDEILGNVIFNNFSLMNSNILIGSMNLKVEKHSYNIMLTGEISTGIWDFVVYELAHMDKIPTKVSELDNDSQYLTSIPSEYITESELNAKKYLTSYTETDPTVPAWAKAASKPTYTKSEVGLGNVDNTSDANKPVSTAQATAIADAKKAGTDAQSNLNTHTSNKSNPHGVTKAQVGLSNVDNVKQYSASNPPVVVQSGAPSDTSVIWVDIDDNSGDEISNDEKLKWESYITTELAKRGQLAPEYAESIEECTDTTKLYVLPDGYIYGHMLTKTQVGGYTNLVRISTDSDGVTIYNGGMGYKNNVRVRSGGVEISDDSAAGAVATGFIPVNGGDVIRFSGWDFSVETNRNAINVSDSSFTNIGQTTINYGSYGIFNDINGAYRAYGLVTIVKESEGVWKWVVPPADSGIAYIRVTAHAFDGSTMIVTVNEEIVESSTTISPQWKNTGHAFVPADYEDRIITLEEKSEENTEFITELKKQVDNIVDGTTNIAASTKFDPTVYGLPVLYLTGDISSIAVSKDNKVTLDYKYETRTGTCTLKGQGASSYNMAKNFIAQGKAGKFNYTITFDNAFEAKTGWGSQKKYCLKANWIDHTHARNIVSCKLWGLIVKSRTNVSTALSSLPNGGAIDGFPIVIMLNDEFHGLYTWNIPKDGWMLGLSEDSTKTQAIMSAHQHSPATQFKGELAGDESDFELEFVSDKNNTDWVTTSLNRLINACINSDGSDIDTVVGQYIDLDSAIDYYIHCVVEKGSDAVDKNFLLVTFDGTKWYFTDYDRDTTYGLAWDASGLSRAVSDVTFESCATTSKLWELIRKYKTQALKDRYTALRKNILSETRICNNFETFAWDISPITAQEDIKKYPTIRGASVNTVDQICRWINQRLEETDKWIDKM